MGTFNHCYLFIDGATDLFQLFLFASIDYFTFDVGSLQSVDQCAGGFDLILGTEERMKTGCSQRKSLIRRHERLLWSSIVPGLSRNRWDKIAIECQVADGSITGECFAPRNHFLFRRALGVRGSNFPVGNETCTHQICWTITTVFGQTINRFFD